MNFFDGLHPFEVILLLLGVLLFLVLLYALVTLIKRDKPYGGLLLFFSIPIIMIGYPSVQSFEISESGIKISKLLNDLEKNPTDAITINAVERELENVSGRSFADTNTSMTIARAQLAVGHDSAAESRIEEVLQKNPQLPAARELKEQINLQRKLVTLTSQVEQNPSDIGAIADLATTANKVARFTIVGPETRTNIARAQTVLGNASIVKTPIAKAPIAKAPKPIGSKAPSHLDTNDRRFSVYSIPPNSVQEVPRGSNCIFMISRGGYSSDAAARQDISDTRFAILVNKRQLEPTGRPTTFNTDNGAQWHISQEFEIRNIGTGEYRVIGTTHSTRRGDLDSRSFVIRCR